MTYESTNYPEFKGSSAIAGKKFLLYVAYSQKWNLVGGLRDNGLDVSAESIDASSKDNGGWGESIPGTRSWTSSPSLVVKTNNEGDNIIEAWVLSEDLQNERPALQFAFVNSQTKEYYTGWGTVSSYSYEASYDDVMIKSMEIGGVGPIEKKTAFNAETIA